MNPFLRFAFHLFYNPFAFTYDFVSALVSRGHWRGWTRTAIPHVVGSRILEVPCGTGNLLCDLFMAGYSPIGADLSTTMLSISHGKLRNASLNARLVRTRVEELPFPATAFDSIVMTFPPSFVFDPHALAELHRVLDDRGRLICVDGGRLLRRGAWSRVLNRALDVTGGEGNFESVSTAVLSRAGYVCQVETVRDAESVVMVVIATKRRGA